MVAEEINKLREEARALKRIRESIGTANFAEQVFKKVYDSDIKRLRSMEEMWRSRNPPIALNFSQTLKDSRGVQPSVSKQDQQPWNVAENFTVFSDR